MAQEVQGRVPDYRQVFRSVSSPHPAFVLTEGEVQRPVDAVLDAPGSGLPGAVFGRPSPGWRCNREVPNCQNAHPIRCRSSQYHHHHPLYRRLVHTRHFNTCTPTLGKSGCLGPGTRSGLARLLLPDDTAAGQAYTAGSGTLTFVAGETSRTGWVRTQA